MRRATTIILGILALLAAPAYGQNWSGGAKLVPGWVPSTLPGSNGNLLYNNNGALGGLAAVGVSGSNFYINPSQLIIGATSSATGCTYVYHLGTNENLCFLAAGSVVNSSRIANVLDNGSGLGPLELAGNVTLDLAVSMPGIGNLAGNDILCFTVATGAVTYEPSVAGCVPSALRFKNPLGVIDPQVAAAGLRNLHPAVWVYKDTQQFGAQPYEGVYADDVCAMDERLCSRDHDGRINNYDKVGVAAWQIAAWQEHDHQIAELTVAVRQLQAQVAWWGKPANRAWVDRKTK